MGGKERTTVLLPNGAPAPTPAGYGERNLNREAPGGQTRGAFLFATSIISQLVFFVATA